MVLRGAPPSFGTFSPLEAEPVSAESLEKGMANASRRLLSLQRPDGHWCGELEGDSILESEYILLQAFLGRVGDPRIAKCARYLLTKQMEGGGWGNYPGGPAEVSTTVKAYFALKIAGRHQNSDSLRRARHCILDLGGAETVNSFTRFYLAALGQIPYSSCPTVPPELVLLPKWFPLCIYNMSSWTRTIIVPLAIVQAHQKATLLPASMGIKELFRSPGADQSPPASARLQGRLVSWANVFRLVDRVLKTAERTIPLRWRGRGIKAAERWMLQHFEGSDGLGAIFPPMVYTIMALKCLGYAEDSAEFKWAEKQLDDMIIEENDAIRLQPCVSPVWDTALAAIALAEAGTAADDPALLEAADWLLAREIRAPGDYSVRHPKIEPSGWAFEYNNRFYPDLDDTAMVLLALKRTARFSEPACRAAVDRATAFLEAMQSRDHGWAAFDRDVCNPILEAVPFADHNAMLDPTCPDITARVLEAFGVLGWRRGQASVDNAIQYVLDRQEPEGCWYGRWGVNYIYGTWQALVGLAAIGYDMRHPRIRKAVDWLVSMQQEDGGWGESAASYPDRSQMGKGPATASQTAWGVMGLTAAGEAQSVSCQRGVEYLLANQAADGGWQEPEFTGTGFPCVFYLRYHYYRLYFPLLALARYQAAQSVGAAVHNSMVLPMHRTA